MIRIFTRQIEKLHSRDGQALVFVAMVGLLIFLFFAMTMNLAEVVHVKIKKQNTADAAALSAAVWQARALNTVSALNQNILDFWVSAPAGIVAMATTAWVCAVLCCGGQCMTNPQCLGCIVIVLTMITALVWSAVLIETTGQLQDAVLASFNAGFVLEDLPPVVNLNYDFKPTISTEDIDTELFMYLNENSGNLFLRNGGGPGVDYVLERGGLCELILGILYNYCRRGRIQGGGCGAGNSWVAGMRALYQQMEGGIQGGVDTWYSPGGNCLGSAVPPAWQGIAGMERLFPYVLRTYRNHHCCPADYNCCIPVNPEDALPLTVGLYREALPPVVHMYGPGSRKDMECPPAPEPGEASTFFPCTSGGHFAFASAHAYSPYVAEFYWHLYARTPDTMGYETIYPAPVVPAKTDWEARLFPLEPLMELGDRSNHAGRTAYEDLLIQVRDHPDLGPGAETFLRNNVLVPPAGYLDFFLY